MTDRFVVRAVVLGLFALGLIFGAGIVYLSATGNDHGVLDNLTAVVVGALAGVLSRTNTDPQPVVVQNEPVQTTEVPAKRRRRETGATLIEMLVAILVVALILVVFAALVHRV